MAVAALVGDAKLPPTPWGYLPPRIRVLLIAGPRRSGAWLASALAADSATAVQLEEAAGIAAGLLRLRDELFDAVLVSHEPERLDAWEALDAIRAGVGEDQALVVLGDSRDEALTVYCLESGGDAYLCTRTATTRSLLWVVARAIERRTLIAEHRRLGQTTRQWQQQEHAAARQRLDQQRALVAGPHTARDGPAAAGAARAPSDAVREDPSSSLPQPLVPHYQELLRAYVVMGSGHLADEVDALAALLAGAHVPPRDVLRLHLHVLEQLVTDLGTRSARHVMDRADVLSLEMMLRLAEQYRAQCAGQVCPPPARAASSGGP